MWNPIMSFPYNTTHTITLTRKWLFRKSRYRINEPKKFITE